MSLSQEAITSFQALYQSKFGVLLSAEEAESEALALLDLFSEIYKPIPKAVTTRCADVHSDTDLIP